MNLLRSNNHSASKWQTLKLHKILLQRVLSRRVLLHTELVCHLLRVESVHRLVSTQQESNEVSQDKVLPHSMSKVTRISKMIINFPPNL